MKSKKNDKNYLPEIGEGDFKCETLTLYSVNTATFLRFDTFD